MKTTFEITPRRAYTLSEVATMFGRHRSWIYRQVREKRITTIAGFGSLMIPEHELRRILGEGTQTTGSPSEG